jgi:hypothetical protein
LIESTLEQVSVDLVRAGDWRGLMRPESPPAEAADATYRAVVRTAGRRSVGYLFPMPLTHSLPDIPVPLRAGDVPVNLPLRSMLETVYADGRYDVSLDYRRPLDPPLNLADTAWVDQLLRKSGKIG